MTDLLTHIVQRSTKVTVKDVVDECGDSRRIGHRGVVVGFVTDDHGATPSEPAWLVRFTDGHKDLFWGEELELAPEDVEANHTAKGGTYHG